MPFRPLGRSGLATAPLVFGGNVLGWTADEATSFRLLDAFVDGGFNMVDTADVYSRWASGHRGGESETVIGRWLRATGKRHRVLIATKVGKPMGEEGSGRSGLSRRWIRQAVEDSLRRLAQIAFEVNERTENIGARRLATVMERLLDEISFDAPNRGGQTVVLDAAAVDARLAELAKNEDLSRYIL